MQIRWKLLLVLLVISLPPMAFVNWLDQQVTKKLGFELAEGRQKDLVAWAGDLLARAIADQGRVLERDHRLIEATLSRRAADIESALARGHPVAADDSGRFVAAGTEAPAWLLGAWGAGQPVWDRPDGDDDTLRAAMRVVGADGGRAGVAVVDKAAESLLDGLGVPERWADQTARFVVETIPGSDILAVVAGRGAVGGTGPQRLEPAPGAPPDAQIGRIAADVRAGATGAAEIPFRGRMALWAWGPAGPYPYGLVVVVPRELVVAGAIEASRHIERRTQEQMAITGTSVVVFGLMAIVLSLYGARTITRPVHELIRVARHIADGDLSARADLDTGDELQELGDTFDAMVPKLRDRIKMREALGLAMEVQQNLLPSESPELKGFELAGSIIYCDETGGDYYDFVELADLGTNRVGVAVGDVSGHGIAAALLMTTARALLRSHASKPGTLSQLMTDINRHLARDASRGRFMTLFYGVIEENDHTFRWVNAGHEPAILYDPAFDSFDELGGDDIPLGIDPGWTYDECARDVWRAGQVVVIGTDGIRESRNPDGVMFGAERLRAIIRAAAAGSADDICAAVSDAVTAFRQGRGQEDDATVVVIKVKEL